MARYYRPDVERNEPISTEITGYTASAYAYLFQKTGKPEFYERALLTADFLTDLAWNRELKIFPFEYPGLTPAYFFDCGIIARGLLAVWRISGERRYLDAATAGGEAMRRDFDAGVDFHPILELPSKKPMARDGRWSRSSGCYQLKAAMAWRELADATGHEGYGRAFERMLQFARAEQGTFLESETDENRVMDRLHAYSYYLEALVSIGQDVREGVERAAKRLREIAPRFVRADVHAQLLRVRLLSGAGLECAECHAAALAKFQAVDEEPRDRRIAGGFYFGERAGKLLPYVNPVTTIFAMQALEMWREHAAGRLERDCRVLI